MHAEGNLSVSSCTRFLKNFPRRSWVPMLLSSSNADKVADASEMLGTAEGAAKCLPILYKLLQSVMCVIPGDPWPLINTPLYPNQHTVPLSVQINQEIFISMWIYLNTYCHSSNVFSNLPCPYGLIPFPHQMVFNYNLYFNNLAQLQDKRKNFICCGHSRSIDW